MYAPYLAVLPDGNVNWTAPMAVSMTTADRRTGIPTRTRSSPTAEKQNHRRSVSASTWIEDEAFDDEPRRFRKIDASRQVSSERKTTQVHSIAQSIANATN